jgi:hypothetical protein
MTLAIFLVVFAVITLFVILRVSVSRSLLHRNASLPGIEPIDVEAFRNLVNPAENEYLHRQLPSAEFRRVQRERLRAAATYIRIAGRNATVLVAIGQAAMAASDEKTAEAARQLVDSALLLRRNTSFALMRINLAIAWPTLGSSAAPVLSGYERLNGCAMLLGRLQNPAVPVRISSVS